jgi:hypothetical protein
VTKDKEAVAKAKAKVAAEAGKVAVNEQARKARNDGIPAVNVEQIITPSPPKKS